MRTATIGLGRMGLRHVSVLQAMGVDIVGLCDTREEARLDARRSTGLGTHVFFEDAGKMLKDLSPHLVVVATTAPTHALLVELAASNRAKYIFCEKPLATSLAAADSMLKCCALNGAKLAVNHQMRFMEQYTLPRLLLESESYGGFKSVSVTAGNFGIAMNGTHYFEMFRFMAAEPAARVSASFSTKKVPNPRGAQFEDAAGCVRIETASGKRFFLDCSSDQGHGVFVVYMARNGRITIDELTGEMIEVVREAEHRDEPTTRYGMPAEVGRRQIAPADATAPTRSVLEALLTGGPFPTGEEGRLALEALVAAHVSHQEGGRVVDLTSEQLPRDLVLPIA